MDARVRPFALWLVPLAVVAAAIVFVVADPGGFATRLGELEFDAFRRLRPPSVPLKPLVSLPAQVLFLELCGAALAFLLAWRRVFWALAFAIAAVAAAQGLTSVLFAEARGLFDSASACAALLLAAASGLVIHAFASKEERRRAPAQRNGATEPAPLRENGGGIRDPQSRIVTSLACGLRRAPRLARSFDGDTAGLIRLIEETMAPLVEDAAEHGAAPGHFDGLSFSAHWRASLDGSGNAAQACEAASRMIVSVARINERFVQEPASGDSPSPMLEIGIGIATAPAAIGFVRARGRTGACAIGSGSVMAEQIRALSERYGPAVIVSEQTREAAERAHAFLLVDFIVLEPGGAPVRLYAMLGNAVLRASPQFRAIAAFHEHIFQAIRGRQWEKARALIEQARKLSGASQTIYDLHLARIGWYEANPPAPEWDGAFRPVLQ